MSWPAATCVTDQWREKEKTRRVLLTRRMVIANRYYDTANRRNETCKNSAEYLTYLVALLAVPLLLPSSFLVDCNCQCQLGSRFLNAIDHKAEIYIKYIMNLGFAYISIFNNLMGTIHTPRICHKYHIDLDSIFLKKKS